MSTRKITSIIQQAQSKIADRGRRIDKNKFKKIAVMASILVTMPIIVQAAPVEPEKPAEPLSEDQSKKLAQNLSQLYPTAKEEPKKIVIEVAPDPEPEPQPQPEPPAPAPAPRPAVRQTSRTTRVATARRSSATRAASAGSSWEQCIPFARRISGVQVRGYAGDVRPNSSEASVGSVALFAGYGHAAVVTGVNGESVTIKEANYVPGKITERTVPKSQLRGYVK